jgi:hypothetical protein
MLPIMQCGHQTNESHRTPAAGIVGESKLFGKGPLPSMMSRGQVICPAAPDSTAVVKGSSTSGVLLLLQTELMMVTEGEDEG